MNYEIRCAAFGLLGVAACVLSEPIGETPPDSSTGGATGGANPGSASSGEESSSTASSSGIDDTGGFTTEVPSGDTEASTGGDTEGPSDTGGSPACSGIPEDNFSWEWSFGSYEPEIDDDDLTYEADATVPLVCDVLSFDEDAEGDELLLTLGCEAEGSPIENQQLSLSPIPLGLAGELQEGAGFSVSFRPELECPNGCFIGDNGWLSIRRESDAQIMIHIVDVHRLLPPDELAPISVTATDSGCSRVFDTDGFCPTPGWIEELDVVIVVPNDTVTVTGAGEESAVNHRIYVNHAFTGMDSPCSADGGDRAGVQLMVVWVFAIK